MVLEFFIKKSIFFQPEILHQDIPVSFHVPKEIVEQWIVQAIGCKGIGAGNSALDVVKENEFGADIKMVSCKLNKDKKISNKLSGETSLAQNFKDTGMELDNLFAKQQYEDILSGWKRILHSKLVKAKEMYNLPKIYYIFILRSIDHLYLCAFEILTDNIKNLTVQRANKMNIYIDGLIDNQYGESKIYKSKKRLELRLNPNNLIHIGNTIPLNLDFVPKIIDLRQMIQTEQIINYQDELFQNIFKAS